MSQVDSQGGTDRQLVDQVKHLLEELFATHVTRADDYPSVEDYTDELEHQVWALTQYAVKMAYLKGLNAGEGRRTKAA